MKYHVVLASHTPLVGALETLNGTSAHAIPNERNNIEINNVNFLIHVN
jgi:hypothetical protein